MLRFLGIILLSVCVVAMPSYAAVTCGSACAVERDAHEHACCPSDATAVAASHDDDAPRDSSHSGGGRGHHCAAPCCGYVATVLTVAATRIDDQPCSELIPPATPLTGSVDHEAIFHPPRI